MRAARHADLVEVELHGRSVGKQQRHGCSLAARRADGAEQVYALIALVGGLPGPRATARPLLHDTVLLANSGFILKPHLDGLALRRSARWASSVRGKPFNSSMIRASCAGWRGRALICEKPSSFSSLPT